MRRALIVFALISGGLAAGAAGFACSSDPALTEVDAGFDGSKPVEDTGTVLVDGGKPDTSTGSDAGRCAQLKGSCDLVTQDCPSGKECVVVASASGNELTTDCQPAGSGNKPVGAKCCPDQANQCVAGLECVGAPCGNTDSGVGQITGRCTPHCCDGDDTPCGASLPEGFKGTCDSQLVTDFGDASVAISNICTYKGVCTPFQIQPCPNNFACLLQGDGVSFRCSGIFNPPGKDAGVACSAANDCADGMECLGPADGGSTCRTICYRADGGAPFDGGGLIDAGAGKGSCPPTKGCGGTITGAPAWLGFCTP
jgi:hypothetical protein